MPPKQPLLSPSGRKINDLRGRRFGALTVTHFAKWKFRHSYWCCKCDCGNACQVEGTELVTGRQKSCGHMRADPEVRRAAAYKVPVKKRKERAQKAAKACRGVSPPPAYRLTLERAAILMGTGEDHIVRLCDTGVLRCRWNKGFRRVSATDVTAYIAMRVREEKTCPMAG